ncbi:PspA/IM30 family protein [bacterium]|nr:PspA/IM30 family protein [bacterium]
MSLWKRFKRIVRSWFGWAAELGEDPELILKQNIRDLEAEVPRLNEQLAQFAAQKNIVERELKKLREQESDNVAKAKAALKTGRRDIAQGYVVDLERLKQQILEKDRAVKNASEALDKAQQMKKVFMAEKDRKIQDAQRALSAKRQAEWNEKVADTLAAFQVGGVDQTHEEMIRRIEAQTATSEAKLQIALDSKQVGNVGLEEEARKIQAEETLRQFELEMGLAAPVSSAPAEGESSKEKTIGHKEREKA